MKACFKGGPLDGQFMEIPEGHLTWEVARTPDLTRGLRLDESLEPVPIVHGRYELVPTEDDPLWRIARLYDWMGWDDKQPDETERYSVIVVRQVGSRVIWARMSTMMPPEQQLSSAMAMLKRRDAREILKHGVPWWEFANRLEGRDPRAVASDAVASRGG